MQRRHARRVLGVTLVFVGLVTLANTIPVGASGSATTWAFRDVVLSRKPSSRLLGGMTTIADGSSVIYGGSVPNGGIDSDTWVYTPANGWVPKCGTAIAGATGACGPGERAFYGGLGPGPTGAVLFGGADNNGNTFSDTWVWNGSAWHQVCASNACGPSQRFAPAVAGNGNQVVLFGGQGADADTWTFDGAHWTQTCGTAISLPCGPPVLGAASMAWDGTQFVLFGGSQPASGDFGPPVDDTWTFNGTTWSHVCGTSISHPCGPAARGLAGFSPITNPNPARRGAILAGGGDLFGNGAHHLERDAWFWHAGTWTNLAVPWPATPVTFTDPNPPPVGSSPLLGMLASEPATCSVLYEANTVAAVDGTNVTVSPRTITGGWDLTGDGQPTGCTAPTTTTTSSSTSTTVAASPTTVARAATVAADPELPATGSTSLPITLFALALIAIGLAAIRSSGRDQRARRY